MRLIGMAWVVSFAALSWLPSTGGEVPFTVPFANNTYTGGYLEAVGDDGKSGAVVYWHIDADEIHLGLAGAGMWVGFGMNEKTPSMQGADIVICQEHQPGIVSAADFYAPRLGAPELDTDQDWVTTRAGRELYKPPTAPAGACKPGWTFGLNRCYKVGRANAYHQAQKECQDEGASLVSIDSAVENKFVLDLAMGEDPQRVRGLVWIVLNRADASSPWFKADTCRTGPGTFICNPASSDTDISFTNWHDNLPSTDQHDCGVLSISDDARWFSREKPDSKWYASHCMWQSPRALCERAPEPGTPQIDLAAYEPLLPVTWCEISRARQTCDAQEDYQLKDLTVAITGLLAWAPPSQVDDRLRYHQAGNRRQQQFAFCGDVASDTGLPSDAMEVIFTPPEHTVTAGSGSFAYSYHKFDIDPEKAYHVIQWRLSLNRNSPAGKAGLQHHMDLRGCKEPIPGASPGSTISAALAMQYCQEVFLTASRVLPSDEGIPIGKDAGFVYLAIERHYYNPTGKPGLIDYGSKFYVTYTQQLRPKEMSSIHIGTTALKVPPKRFGFVMRSHCPSGCTQKMGQVLATRVSFHAHGHTQAAFLRHIRDGIELEPIAAIEPYEGDAFAQRNVNVVILPGDELLLDCVYDNDLDTTIVYGDGINDEMCWGTLSVVGKNPVSKCHDAPDPSQNKWPSYDTDCAWCVKNNKFDQQCWQCNIAEPFTRCPGTGEDMGTGRVNDLASRRGNPNAGNEVGVLKYTPYVRSVASCGVNSIQEVVPAIAGSCPADALISGVKDCPFKWGGSMRVSWETNCSAKTVTFTLEKYGSNGWMGIGLHDGGTADVVIPIPSTRMNGADIVQVSPSSGTLKDAYGSDYMTPSAKSNPSARLDSSRVANGKMTASFTRPFAASQGTVLEAGRFVWLVCAYRGSSDDMDAKHEQATAIFRSRVSLFGGVPESTRSKPKAASSSSFTSANRNAQAGVCQQVRSVWNASNEGNDVGITGIQAPPPGVASASSVIPSRHPETFIVAMILAHYLSMAT